MTEPRHGESRPPLNMPTPLLLGGLPYDMDEAKGVNPDRKPAEGNGKPLLYPAKNNHGHG